MVDYKEDWSYWTGDVHCCMCTHEWKAVVECSAEYKLPDSLECPECGYMTINYFNDEEDELI